MKTIRLYGVKPDKKQEIYDLVDLYANENNISAKAVLSNAKKLKGVECTRPGSKSVFMYIDLLNRVITYFDRKKAIGEVKF